MTKVDYDEVDLYPDLPRNAGAVQDVLSKSRIRTPALVIDDNCICQSALSFSHFCGELDCKPLYSTKALGLPHALNLMNPYLAGYSASSVAEARTASFFTKPADSLHITSPGLRADQIEEIFTYCSHVSFNSVEMLQRVLKSKSRHLSSSHIGLRINPEYSIVEDSRFDPCKPESKLGVPLTALLHTDSQILAQVSGLHFHTNCDDDDLGSLAKTLDHIGKAIPKILDKMQWLNIGGGYIYPDQPPAVFREAIQRIRENRDLTIYIEPGASLVRRAGYILTSVIDLFTRDGVNIAVLDTTVNHFPEAFEYQYGPDVYGDDKAHPNDYRLVGCTCLAGDDLGIYGFDQPIEVGSKLVIYDVGAYTQVKWHTFNGIELPDIYSLDSDGNLHPLPSEKQS